MKKRITALILVLLLLFCGCGKSSSLGFDINYGVNSFDPQLASTDSELIIIKNCFTGLFDQDEKGALINALCENYEISDDGLTYTFKIRKKCFWNDGETPITANDFAFAFERLFMPETNAPHRSDFFDIENARKISNGESTIHSLGVNAIDDYTLRIRLENENPMFLELLSTAASMPCNKEFFSNTRGKYGLSLSYILFNGTYYVRRINNSSYVLSPNDESIFPNKSYENIYLFVKDNPMENAKARLLDNIVDAAVINSTDMESLRESGFNMRSSENTTWVMEFNTKNEFLTNQNIRRAVAYSIDKSLVEEKLPENFTIADAFVPPSVSLNGVTYRKTVGYSFTGFGFDPILAQDLYKIGMEEQNLSKPPALTLLCPQQFVSALGFLQKSIQDTLGIYVNLNVLPESKIISSVASGNFDLAMIPITPQYSNPSSVLSVFTDKNNPTGYYSEQFVESVKEAGRSRDYNDMALSYSVSEQILLQEMAALPLFYETSYFAVSPKINGLDYSVFGGHIVFRFCN